MLHNDNFNKREYVVQVLLKVVKCMTVDDAVNVMQVHAFFRRVRGYKQSLLSCWKAAFHVLVLLHTEQLVDSCWGKPRCTQVHD